MTTQQVHRTSTHLRATFGLAVPLAGSHLAQMLTHVTDTVMLGWYGVDALAAATLATSVYFVFFIVGTGFAMAVMPLAAAAAASDDTQQVRRSVRMGLWISIIFGIIVSPALYFSNSMFLGLGQQADLSLVAQSYMRIALLGLFPAMTIMVLKSFFSALERPNVVLIATIGGAALNIIANYMLIFGNWGAPELGVRGAAIASVLTQFLALFVLILFLYLQAEFKKYDLFVRIWRSDWVAFAEVFRLGWPIGITMLAESGLFSASAIMMGWLGVNVLAAHGIALQVAAVTFMVYLGLSNAATVRAGRALGRKDIIGVRMVSTSVLILTAIAIVATVAIFLVLPEQLLRLFLSPDDPQTMAIVAIGVPLLAAAALFQMADAGQVVVLGLLRGLKDTTVPMIIAAVSYWGVGMPVSYGLGFYFGYGGVGIWIGLAAGLFLAWGLMSLRLFQLIGNKGRLKWDAAPNSS